MLSLTEVLERKPSLFNLALEKVQFADIFWLKQVFESSLHSKEVVERLLVRIHVHLVFSFLNLV